MEIRRSQSVQREKGWKILPIFAVIVVLFFAVVVGVLWAGNRLENMPFRLWYNDEQWYGEPKRQGVPEGYEEMEYLGEVYFYSKVPTFSGSTNSVGYHGHLYSDGEYLYCVDDSHDLDAFNEHVRFRRK